MAYIFDQAQQPDRQVGTVDGAVSTTLYPTALAPGELVIDTFSYGNPSEDAVREPVNFPGRIDPINITIVPEPASAALFELGLVLLAARRQHRRIVVA